MHSGHVDSLRQSARHNTNTCLHQPRTGARTQHLQKQPPQGTGASPLRARPQEQQTLWMKPGKEPPHQAAGPEDTPTPTHTSGAGRLGTHEERGSRVLPDTYRAQQVSAHNSALQLQPGTGSWLLAAACIRGTHSPHSRHTLSGAACGLCAKCDTPVDCTHTASKTCRAHTLKRGRRLSNKQPQAQP